MKRKWWLAVVVLMIVAAILAVLIPALMPPAPGVTYANYGRLEKGMTRDEAAAILGRPNLQNNADGMAWRNDDEDTVIIEFDKSDRVKWFAWNDWPEERTLWQKLRDRVPMFAKPPPSRI